MVELDETDEFWGFALACYERPGVEGFLLHLQDERGADIPLLLWIAWTASQQCLADDRTLSQAVLFSNDWRENRVEPLRALRIEWKSVSDANVQEARKIIAKAEQGIERLQMRELADLQVSEASTETAPDLAKAMLGQYQNIARIEFTAEEISEFLSFL